MIPRNWWCFMLKMENTEDYFETCGSVSASCLQAASVSTLPTRTFTARTQTFNTSMSDSILLDKNWS